ncbi:MAG: hypothetical protein KW804_00430 [Candidatus Doudnabacteria bacterium]|nr:hypothetical protein [Candidatus Doudnabacteria bacterium]
MNKPITIVMFPKIQIDTSIAYLLLHHFGEAKFPGIKDAKLEFWMEMPKDKTTEQLENEGYILIDLGNSRFDHHKLGPENNKISTAHMVAKYLGIEDRADLQKMLEFARRDDLEGKGTMSNDSIDRTFGLSGLLTTLNKTIGDNPHKILDVILTMLTAHLIEENKRHELTPKEYDQLKSDGKVKEFTAHQLDKQLKVIYVESDNAGLAGYLRSRAIGADLVIQKASMGHTNFVSRQQAQLQLKKLSKLLKLAEAQKIGLKLTDSPELEKPGRTDKLPHWYYDSRANTIQNGGLSPQGIPPTNLTYKEIEQLVKDGLNIHREERFTKDNPYKVSKGKGVVFLD